MRTKDDKKQEALFLATIKLVNEIGFAASSVAKIAREAGVSPATLYVYFKNKDDLLISTYLEVKLDMGAALLEGFDDSLPLRDIFHRFWCNAFAYMKAYSEEFRYAEQFANSPYSEQVNPERVQAGFAPLLAVFTRGVEQKVLKDVSLDIFSAFMFAPVKVLANPSHCRSFDFSDEEVEIAFEMAWDAVRL